MWSFVEASCGSYEHFASIPPGVNFVHKLSVIFQYGFSSSATGSTRGEIPLTFFPLPQKVGSFFFQFIKFFQTYLDR